MTASLRFLLPVAIGAALGAAVGYSVQCSDGACPLTATWWRGALSGAVFGCLLSLGQRFRSSP